ncbi:MAG: hypothetical protein RhofKO_34790 [Rhodothermales bacterium]
MSSALHSTSIWLRLGAWAAYAEALFFVIGFALYLTLLSDASYGSLSRPASDHVQFLIAHQAVLYAWYLLIYVAFGIGLVGLAQAIFHWQRHRAPIRAQLGLVFGIIWAVLVIASGMVANVGFDVIVRLSEHDAAAAESLWYALHVVTDGLGGGNEVVGGLWILLISSAGWRTRLGPRYLHGFGWTVGGAGVLTTLPPLADLGALFGLGSIVWFIALGVALWQASRATDYRKPPAEASGLHQPVHRSSHLV